MTRPTLPKSLALPAATFGALAAHSALGAISYFDFTDINVLDGGDTIYFDLQTGAAGTSIASVAGWDAKLWSSTFYPGEANLAEIYVGASAQTSSLRSSGFYTNALRLNAGDMIGGSYTPGQQWVSGADATYPTGMLRNEFIGNPAWTGYWVPGNATDGTGYLGLAISNGSGSYNYGWAHVTVANDRSVTLHDFAIEEEADTPIQAGAIPEPSTYAALTGLLAGSAALYTRRRKRAA